LGVKLLEYLQQSKLDQHQKKKQEQEKRSLLGIQKNFNLQEEYFKLAPQEDDWDFVRVPRPVDES
jgi:hypothetical protein